MPKAPTIKETTRRQSKRQLTVTIGHKNKSSVEPKKGRVRRKLSGDDEPSDASEPVALSWRPPLPPDANTKGLPSRNRLWPQANSELQSQQTMSQGALDAATEKVFRQGDAAHKAVNISSTSFRLWRASGKTDNDQCGKNIRVAATYLREE
ncbi:hypothetical protein BDZ89DRAFT_1220271 [Hymenopellis radicata]|nr:hypothetical protein BDZ89DRAFT_1220271 [Hymenopellis radicata]